MNTDSFKLYDLRGKYPEVVNEQLAFALGNGLSSWKKPKTVVVAGDIRKSTPSLKKYLIDGFGKNVEILELGEVPVPEFYFTVIQQKADLGVMITASHLHADDNGFKIVGKNALPLDQSEILKIKQAVGKLDHQKIVIPVRKIKNLDETDNYIDDLITKSNLKKVDLKMVLDTTKSSVSTVTPQLFKKLNANYILCKTDHEGNPLLAENRKELEEKVKSTKADLGIIWDSDGDRVAFVDPDGKFIPMSFVLAILGSEAIKENGGGVVGVDVRAGLVVRDEVELAGGKIEVFPAWHQSLQFAMQENPKIVFAGENSGHFLFKNFHATDDGLFTALKFLNFCQENDLRSTLKHLSNRYFELPEMNYKIHQEKAVAVQELLANHYRSEGYEVSLIDGLTVFGPDWKFNLRSSVTEGMLRLNLEAANFQKSKAVMDTLSKFLED